MENKLANAIIEDELYQVYSIINEGIDFNVLDETGMTPLMHAVEAENIRLIELFIALGADINVAGHEGFTALHHSIDVSIDGTIQNGGKQGEEPLSIISFLIDNGADVTAKTDKGETPLDLATNYKAHKVMEFLSATKP
ncbi:MAG: ankyrin repeat domain-containing protein [Oleiphilus sp.]